MLKKMYTVSIKLGLNLDLNFHICHVSYSCACKLHLDLGQKVFLYEMKLGKRAASFRGQ